MRIARNIRAFSLAGVATAALFSAASAQTPAAASADGSPVESIDEIVVTGSSIRGASPVGSNLTMVTAADIQATPAQTLQQILTSVPAVNGFGMAGQGAFQSNDGAGSNIPSIHGLGGSSSTSTLVLIDGHRFPLTGVVHTLGDPNMIPPNAIQRVEVLADGASSVYGSDAVAGVINFITRSRFDGVEAAGQMGFADGYKNWNASLLAGKTWDNASIYVAYAHSDRGNLSAGDRPFTQADHRAQGGSNLATFNCQPASVQPAGGNLAYLYPYTGAGIVNVQANAPCDFGNANSDLLPEEIRDAVMVKGTVELTPELTITADMVFSDRRNTSRNARGSTTTTIFGPGSGRGTQINPFYQNVGGGTATSQTVRLNFDELLGPGAKTDAGARDFFFHTNVEYRLNDNWRIVASGVAGVDESFSRTTGTICGSCANLALNGTTNGGGSLTAVSVPSTGLIVLQPLTTANALDPYNPAGSNRTSAEVLARLRDSKTERRAWQSIADATVQINGSLFTLPGGDVKVALGGEFARYGVHAASVTSLNIGPSSTGSAYATFPFPDRTVWSGFAEVLWPIVSPEMSVPLVRSFQVNTSARYDHYNDVGGTTNPRIGANWEVFSGFKLRGNWAQSFVAPQILFNGIDGRGLNVESGYGQAGQVVGLPIANFPEAAQFPGCASVTVCTIGTGLVTGLQLNGGQPVEPQTGETYSIGADFAPDAIPGLRVSVTYWDNKMKGGLTAPTASLAVGTPSLFDRFTLYPNGATQAQIAAAAGNLPQTSSIPPNVYYIYDFRIGNVLNLYVAGLDVEANYAINTDVGRFTLGNSFTYLTKFDQQTGDGARFSVLNTDGFNSTFPSIRLNGRARAGWEAGNFSIDGFLNYTGSYRNYSGNTVTPIQRDAAGSPIGGGDKVRSHVTVDLHVAYTIDGPLGRTQLYADAKNLFDKDPPFFNSPNGYDPLAGNPLGRLITVGFRSTF